MNNDFKKLYGSSAIVTEAGISMRQLNHWVDRLCVVRPTLKKYGNRFYRRFSFDDLTAIKKMKALIQIGYMPSAAANLIKDKNPNKKRLFEEMVCVSSYAVN